MSSAIKALTSAASISPASTANNLQATDKTKNDPKLRETFDQFVGETFYGQMLGAMRKTEGKTPYFSGGRAEEVFRGQLDQIMSQKLGKANGNQLSGSMFDLFNLQRS